MTRDASPDAVRHAAARLDQRLATCAQAVASPPTQGLLRNPWIIAGVAVAFALLPRRYKKPVLKAAVPMALGLLRLR